MHPKILNYKIHSLIGSGGMGSVYYATDILQRKLAIKVLASSLHFDKEYIDRFIREARTLSSIEHPNIVKIYNFFEYEGEYFMVMEYAEGDSLANLIKRTGPIEEHRALTILKKIADGLCFAHINNIIHRDIKPDNVMVDSNDNIKLLDFGIAKLLNDNSLTRTGTKMGTVYYMSPEQIRAEKDIDNKTDIYSLGIVFYEMLTGRIPFKKTTDSDFLIMKEIIESNIEDPRKYYPNISENTVDLLNRMIEKDKWRRMDSLEDVLTYNMNLSCYLNIRNGDQIKSETQVILSNNKRVNDIVFCTSCNEELELEEDDIRKGVFVCPECNAINSVDINKQLNVIKSESDYTPKMFRDLFSFKGRIRRTEYGLSLIIFYLIIFILRIISQDPQSDLTIIISILYIPLYWFIWAQGAKRCHDRNNSGWFQIIPLYIFWMLFAQGDLGENEFGKNPKGLNL